VIRIKCICGHYKNAHLPHTIRLFAGTDWCEGCSNKTPHEEGVMFHKYTPDNLKYIENLARRKGLV
jgi:hypothetical protein